MRAFFNSHGWTAEMTIAVGRFALYFGRCKGGAVRWFGIDRDDFFVAVVAFGVALSFEWEYSAA